MYQWFSHREDVFQYVHEYSHWTPVRWYIKYQIYQISEISNIINSMSWPFCWKLHSTIWFKRLTENNWHWNRIIYAWETSIYVSLPYVFFFEKIDGALEETFHTAHTVYVIVPAYVSLKKPCIKKYLNQKAISISFSPTLQKHTEAAAILFNNCTA